MTEKMISKNFSNFSAWHYRGNMLIALQSHLQLPELNGLIYPVPLETIDKEFEQMKHALFTEPNDQSSWNYHKWLVNLLSPVQIVRVERMEKGVELEVSEVVGQGMLRVEVDGEE